MGKVKHLNQIMELFKKSPIISLGSIKKYVKNDSYAKLLIHNLIKHKKINKITKGVYTMHNNPELTVFAFKPAYLGLQDALSFHNLWEQETIPIIITSRNVRTGIRNIIGSNLLIRHIDRKFLFGFDYFQIGNIAYPYSDIEKTLIDLVYFDEKIDEAVIKNILSKLDIKKLNMYLKKYDKKTRIKINKIIKKH